MNEAGWIFFRSGCRFGLAFSLQIIFSLTAYNRKHVPFHLLYYYYTYIKIREGRVKHESIQLTPNYPGRNIAGYPWSPTIIIESTHADQRCSWDSFPNPHRIAFVCCGGQCPIEIILIWHIFHLGVTTIVDSAVLYSFFCCESYLCAQKIVHFAEMSIWLFHMPDEACVPWHQARPVISQLANVARRM